MKYLIDEISKRIRTEKTIKAIIKTLIIFFLLILLIANLIMLYETNANSDKIPSICNISIFNIISESMEPEISVNDLIVIEACLENEISIGDIITYKKVDGSIVTHRVVNITEKDEKKQYTTKGDNNVVEDEEKIFYNQILGKYIFKISKAGQVVDVLQHGNGIISIVIIIIIFIIIKNSNDKKKEERKKRREKYDIKKRRDELNKEIQKERNP